MTEKLVEDFKEKGTITFKTGGTVSDGKLVEKTFANMLTEANDIAVELGIGSGLNFISTTTAEHLFGFTFHYMLPYVTGNITHTERIHYPENINFDNAVLVTTPSFLEAMRKYDSHPVKNPKIIISAGAKLETPTFEFAKTIADEVFEIYGSTESGVIAYRKTPNEKLKLFSGIKILETGKDYTKLETNYSKKSLVTVEDRIKLIDNKIEFLGRSGRVLKIQEKRIAADIMEAEIKKSDYIDSVYCFEYETKLAAFGVLSDKGKEFLLQNDKLSLTKILKSELKNEFEIVPQKWIFFDEIPKKENGKINKKFIKECFDRNLSLPLILDRNIYADFACFKIVFINNSNFFKGHFEGFPILAGVVQLFYANWFAQLAFGKDCRCGQIRKIKYSNIIRPAKVVYLEFKKTENNISYKYYDDEFIYSSGVLPVINCF